MIQSLNFPLSQYCIRPYGSWEALGKQVRALGLDGLEVIADPDDLAADVPLHLVTGYHLTFYPDWVDFWRQDEKALLRKFRSWEEVEKIYRGQRSEDLMAQFREDLALAQKLKAPYLVFHVSDVSLEEGYTYRWLHSDKEVLDAAIDFANELLRGVEPGFEFLVENQWWPGFTFTEPEKTAYLLERIDYPRVGVMLDTGHLMNTNRQIKTQKQGIAYILEMLDRHGSLAERVRGLHFHQSLSGGYCRHNLGALPPDFPEEYFAAFAVSYGHIQHIDRHRPWTEPLCAAIIDRVGPEYLTHELSGGYPGGQMGALKRQLTTLRKR
jgi:sugar phosphate isomerase/epimerase